MATKLTVERLDPKGFPIIWITRVGEWWITQSDYEIPIPGHDKPLLIELGFRFDLASVPRWAWWLIAPFELSIAAPLVHDYFYRFDGKIPGWGEVTRKEADDIFLQMMEAEKISDWRRRSAHGAVRLVSWAFWKGKQK